MDKLITDYNGGFPVFLNDIRFEQESVRSAFKALLSAFNLSSESFIISGCDITVSGDDYTVTEGYVCLNGEICKVDAHSITRTGNNAIAWKIDITYNPIGLKVFNNLTTNNTYQIRKAILFNTPFLGADIPAYNLNIIHQNIAQKLQNNWITIPLNLNNFSTGAGGQFAPTYTNIRYNITGNLMVLDIYVEGSFIGAGYNIKMKLPVLAISQTRAIGFIRQNPWNTPYFTHILNVNAFNDYVWFERIDYEHIPEASFTLHTQISVQI